MSIIIVSSLFTVPASEAYDYLITNLGLERSLEWTQDCHPDSWMAGFRKYALAHLDDKMKKLLENPDVEQAMTLIRLGVDPNTTDQNGCTVLFNYLARMQSNRELVMTDDLLELIRLSNRCDCERLTPLHYAVAFENPDLIRALVETGKYKEDLKEILAYAIRDDQTNELCHKAPCSFSTIQCLVELGASLDADFDGQNLMDLFEEHYIYCPNQDDVERLRQVLVGHGLNKSEQEDEW